MKSSWKIHKGVRIFHFDLSGFGLDDKGVMAECDAADVVIMAEPKNSVLVLNDVRGTVGSSMEVIKYLEMSVEKTNPYVARAVVIGVTGSKLAILQLVNLFSKHPIAHFDDFESAADSLVANLVSE